MPIGINEYLARIRDTLPHKYKDISNLDLFTLAVKARPDLKNARFLPDREPPSFIEGLGAHVATFASEFIPNMATAYISGMNLIETAVSPKNKIKTKEAVLVYSLVKEFARKTVQDVDFIRNANEWYADNPFEYNKIFEAPHLARGLGNVLTSWGVIIGAGALGGPWGARFAAGLMEGGDAFSQALDKARKNGASNQESIDIASEALGLYGPAAAILESYVPLSVLKTLGFFSNRAAKPLIKKFASKYIGFSGKPGVGRLKSAEKAALSMTELAKENTTLLTKILSVTKSVGLGQLTEASTEGVQFLLQEAIVEGLNDKDITLDWIGDKMSSPGFKESVAYGAIGGNISGTVSGIVGASGRRGLQTAKIIKEYHTLTGNTPLLHAYVNHVVDSDDLNNIEKVKFAKVMQSYYKTNKLGEFAPSEKRAIAPTVKPSQATKPKPITPVEPIVPTKPIAPVVEPIIEPGIGEPTGEPIGESDIIEPEGISEPEGVAEPEGTIGILSNILHEEEYGKVTSVTGKTPSEKVFNLFLNKNKQIRDALRVEYDSLPIQDRNTVVSLIGYQIENLTKGKVSIKDKSGNYNSGKVFAAIDYLHKKGLIVSTKERSGLAGAETKTTLVKAEKPAVSPTGTISKVGSTIDKIINKQEDLTPEQITELITPTAPIGMDAHKPKELKKERLDRQEGMYYVGDIIRLDGVRYVVSGKRNFIDGQIERTSELELKELESVGEIGASRKLASDLDRQNLPEMYYYDLEAIDDIHKGQIDYSGPNKNYSVIKEAEIVKAGVIEEGIIEPQKKKDLKSSAAIINISNISGDFQEVQPIREAVNKVNLAKSYYRLKKHFPSIKVETVARLVTRWGTEAIGRAVDGLVQIVSNKETEATLPHEYAHIYINMLEEDPIIQKALKTLTLDVPVLSHENSTEDAIAIGLSSRGNTAAINELRKRRSYYLEIFNQQRKTSDFNTLQKISFLAQLYREAVEAAENTGSAALAIKNGSVDYKSSKYYKYGHESLARLIGDHYANRIKNKGLYNKVKIFIKHLINRIKNTFNLLPDEDAPYFLAERFYRGEGAEKVSELLDGRESPDTFEWFDDSNEEYVDDEEDLEPGTFVNRYFENTFGVYLGKDGYAKLVEVAREFKDKSFLDETNFNKYKIAIIEMVESITGTKFGIKFWENGAGFNRKIKNFYQKANSSIRTGMKAENRAVFEVMLDESGLIKKIIPMGKVNPVTNKANPATAVMNFIEEDSFKYGVKNKLIYIPYNMIYVNKTGINRVTGEAHSNYVQASPDYDMEFNEFQLKRLERHFYNDFIRGATNRLLYFFAETGGDNKQFIYSAVPEKLLGTSMHGMNRGEFIEFLKSEVNTRTSYGDTIITGEQAKEMLKSGDAIYEKNNGIYSQIAAYHTKMKSIKGNYYLANQKGISAEYRRLKLDIVPGWVPRGIGDSGIMIINPKEVTIEVNGKPLELFLPDGTYKEDGSMRISRRLMSKIHKVSGIGGGVIKSVIRYFNTENMDDYVNFKMLETLAIDGTKVYKNIGSEKQLVAEYDGNVWKDAAGNTFDRLASTEEMKQSSGKFAKDGLYKIHTLPEESTRILQVHDRTKKSAAFPINAFELAVHKDFDKSETGINLLRAIGEWYDKISDMYLSKLYSFRPKILSDKNIEDMSVDERKQVDEAVLLAGRELSTFLYRELQEGELPSEIDYYIRTGKTGGILYTSNLMKQIVPMITNWFLHDGLYKARNPVSGLGTMLHIKPGLHLDIPRDGYVPSLDNSVIRDNIIRAIKDSGDTNSISIITSLIHDGIRNKESMDRLVEVINKWFESNNQLYTLTHRKPILNTTNVIPRRITGVVSGYGEVGFFHPEDVAWLYEGDNDGDEIFIEFVSNDLINSMLNFSQSEEFSSRSKRYPLSLFKEKSTFGKLENQGDRFKIITSNVKSHAAQGNTVVAKTILSTLAYKNMSFTLPNGEIVKVYDPLDRVIINWMPLLNKDDAVDLVNKYNDKIIERNGKFYLETTKETELSLLLQAAVDEWKYGIISGINFMEYDNFPTWLLTKMFYKVNGKPIEVRSKGNIGDISYLFAIRRLFNYSRDRRGISNNGKVKTLSGDIQRSREISSLYFDANGNRIVDANVISASLLDRVNDSLLNARGKYLPLKALSVNNRIVPTEKLLTALELRDLQETKKHSDKLGFISPNPFVFYPNDHKFAHIMTMREMFNDFGEKLMSDYEKSDPDGFAKTYEFTKNMVKEFMEIHKQHDDSLSAMARMDPEKGAVRYEYSEEFSNFIDKYKEGFDALPNKNISTLIFLYGINYKGFKTKGVLRLLPAQLMSKDMMVEYDKRYAKYLFTKSGIKGKIGTKESRVSNVSNILNRIRNINHCG